MPNPHSAESDLLSRVEARLMEDEDLAGEFEAFAKKHCDIFQETEENKLESIKQQIASFFI